MSDPGPYVQLSQVRRRTLVFLLPYFERAVAEGYGSDEVLSEIANLRNLAYCQSLKEENAPVVNDDWLKL